MRLLAICFSYKLLMKATPCSLIHDNNSGVGVRVPFRSMHKFTYHRNCDVHHLTRKPNPKRTRTQIRCTWRTPPSTSCPGPSPTILIFGALCDDASSSPRSHTFHLPLYLLAACPSTKRLFRLRHSRMHSSCLIMISMSYVSSDSWHDGWSSSKVCSDDVPSGGAAADLCNQICGCISHHQPNETVGCSTDVFKRCVAWRHQTIARNWDITHTIQYAVYRW